MDEFRDYFDKNMYDIICISESWLKPQVSSNLAKLNGYTLLRQDRHHKNGGGVAMYVRNVIKCRELIPGFSPTSAVEYIVTEVNIHNIQLLLIVVYRPPKVGFFTDLENILLNYCPLYSNVVVLGDFNTDFNSHSSDKNYLNNLFASFGLKIIPMKSTHFTINSNSWKDLMFINEELEEKLISKGQNQVPFLSSHDLIYMELNISRPEILPTTVTGRDLRNFDHDSFK